MKRLAVVFAVVTSSGLALGEDNIVSLDEVTVVGDLFDPLSEGRSNRPNGCTPDMVNVGGKFCVDRYEVVLVDSKLHRPLSPYYPALPASVRGVAGVWLDRMKLSSPERHPEMMMPPLPDWERQDGWEPVALSEPDAIPQGYMNYYAAKRACRNAGKRLCTMQEWVTACMGEGRTRYPYGDKYRQGACNTYREGHPSGILHGDTSNYHQDPRLNLVEVNGPLLRKTGDTPACVSRWGDDGAWDMAGNLDEWIDDPGGTFVGGFYSRSTKNGCGARVENHAPEYFDYSIGTRCCDNIER